MQAVLEPKLDAVAKLVALKIPAELDEIRDELLKFWTKSHACSYKVNVAAGFKVHLKP